MLTIHLGSSVVWLSNFFKKYIEIDDFIIPPCSFEIPKKVVLVEISCCPKNEALSKWFINKIDELTNNLYDMRIKWVAKTVKQLFNLKNIKSHPSCVIYVGTCGSSQTYIGETRRNARIRWDKHEDSKKESEHFRNHLGHSFYRNIANSPG